MPAIEYPGFVGPTNKSPDVTWDGSDTVNWFIQPGETGNPKSKARLAETPGCEYRLL